MVLELSGEDKDYQKAIGFLKSAGVRVQSLSQDIIRNETKCTDCGLCVPSCPTGALVVEQLTKKVNFYDNKRIACELCIKTCPVRALEVHF